METGFKDYDAACKLVYEGGQGENWTAIMMYRCVMPAHLSGDALEIAVEKSVQERAQEEWGHEHNGALVNVYVFVMGLTEAN